MEASGGQCHHKQDNKPSGPHCHHHPSHFWIREWPPLHSLFFPRGPPRRLAFMISFGSPNRPACGVLQCGVWASVEPRLGPLQKQNNSSCLCEAQSFDLAVFSTARSSWLFLGSSRNSSWPVFVPLHEFPDRPRSRPRNVSKTEPHNDSKMHQKGIPKRG